VIPHRPERGLLGRSEAGAGRGDGRRVAHAAASTSSRRL
jgi:hypothetical protein